MTVDQPIHIEQEATAFAHSAGDQFPAVQHRAPLNWLTIAMFSTLIAYVDGFWVTSLQGVIGSFGRAEPPFARWLRGSTMMLPLIVLAVVAAVLLARRWVGQGRRPIVQIGVTALLIVLLTSAVSTAEIAASSVWDYHVQSREIDAVHSSHERHAAATEQGAADADGPSTCVGVCAAKKSTLDAHVKGVTIASLLLLISNVVLVVWVLVLRSDRLFRCERARSRIDHQPARGRPLSFSNKPAS